MDVFVEEDEVDCEVKLIKLEEEEWKKDFVCRS